ncbi:hypothetical protein CQW23_33253 [Capsicum baccatum]|uniref:Uncharacterized protein n=1 Tax=Capsicum baccatum TaxID=33114 RepID=A0A2G2V2F9_CAPBA|nr:hypothetical protein CQW23_33253 [Capsicum baccatum]
MMFDESSSWWSSNMKLLPYSDVLKDVLHLSHSQLSLDEAEDAVNEDIIEEDVTQIPWKIGLHQQPGKEGELNRANTPPLLTRLTWIRKQNLKYANTAIVEEENEKDLENFEEAIQNSK